MAEAAAGAACNTGMHDHGVPRDRDGGVLVVVE
jgi:hypothetical protein